MKLAKDRQIKPESMVLESLIADFAREIQILAAPELDEDRSEQGPSKVASPEERPPSSPGAHKDQKRAPANVPSEPAVTQPIPAMPVQQRPPSSPGAHKDQKQAATSVPPKPAVTQPTAKVPFQERREPSSTAQQEQIRRRPESPIRLRKGQDGSWAIVIGKATEGSAWRTTRIPIFTGLAITVALAVGWLVSTGFGLA